MEDILSKFFVFFTEMWLTSKPAFDILDKTFSKSELGEFTSIIVNLILISLNFFLSSNAELVRELIVLKVYSDFFSSKILFYFEKLIEH